MNEPLSLASIMREQGILPLYFHPDPQQSQEILTALFAGGARAVEYTNRGPEALANFAALVKFARREMPEMKLGLGTVLDPGTVDTALEAGADFIISPGVDDGLLQHYSRKPFAWIPGCLTPSEILRVYRAGIRLVKIFPGHLVGPDYVKSIRDLFPGMLYMPTGGVKPEKENLEVWVRAGVIAVGMGSTLIDPGSVKAKDYPALTRAMRNAKNLWAQVRA